MILVRTKTKTKTDERERTIQKNAAHLTQAIYIPTIGITALLLLLPSKGGLSVFSKGEWLYLESLGLIFSYLSLFLIIIYAISYLFLNKKFENLFFTKQVSIKTNTVKEKVVYILAVGASVFLLFAFIGSVWIDYELKNLCQNAQWQYGGDCTEALISQLDDEHQGYRHRNHAIWALGQSGDDRALPILEKYYTSNIPDKEALDETISQYELKKAIELRKKE